MIIRLKGDHMQTRTHAALNEIHLMWANNEALQHCSELKYDYHDF